MAVEKNGKCTAAVRQFTAMHQLAKFSDQRHFGVFEVAALSRRRLEVSVAEAPCLLGSFAQPLQLVENETIVSITAQSLGISNEPRAPDVGLDGFHDIVDCVQGVLVNRPTQLIAHVLLDRVIASREGQQTQESERFGHDFLPR